jgi:hypothetical protein
MLSQIGMAFCDFSRHTMYDASLDASRCFGLFLRRSQVVNSSQLFGVLLLFAEMRKFIKS